MRKPYLGDRKATGERRKLGRRELKRMVKMVQQTKDYEYTCEECFDRLEEYAEYTLVGKEKTEAVALVEDHLNKCMDCREEFELFLKALQGEDI